MGLKFIGFEKQLDKWEECIQTYKRFATGEQEGIDHSCGMCNITESHTWKNSRM